MSSKTFLIGLSFSLLAILSWQLRWAFLIFFGSIVLAVALDVLIQMLQKVISIPRPVALAIVLLIIIICGGTIFLLLVPELITQVKELGTILPTVFYKLKSILSNQPRLLSLQESIPEKFSWGEIQPLGTQLIGFAGGAANSLIQFLLISLISILLVLDPYSHRKIVIAATPRPYRNEINELLIDCRAALGGWLTGMTISASTIFIITWASLSFLGVPLALLSALVCGVLTFLPTIGPTAATILPLGTSLLISPSLMIQVLILRLGLQNIEAFLLTPILLKRTVNLLPSVALMAQIILGALLGLPGVILALPLIVVLQVILQKLIVKKLMDKWPLSG